MSERGVIREEINSTVHLSAGTMYSYSANEDHVFLIGGKDHIC